MKRTGWIVQSLVAVALFASPAFAFDLGDCPSQPFDAVAFERLKTGFQEELKGNRYTDIFLALQGDLERSTLWSHEEKPYKNLHEALRILNGRFAHFDQDLAKVDDTHAFETFLNTYKTGLFQCGNRTYFAGHPLELTFDELEALPGGKAEAKAKDFLFRVQTVDRLLNHMKESSLHATVQGIRNAAMRWELFLKEGRSQYPWEAFINGIDPAIRPENIKFPPSRQWIVLHPELAVELSTNALKDIKAKQSFLVDVVGHTFYWWKNSDNPAEGLQYAGITAVASFRDDLRPGIGVMAHYGRYLNVGAIWHDQNNDGRMFNQSPFFVIGIDLFRFAEYKYPEYKKQYEKWTEKAQEFLGVSK